MTATPVESDDHAAATASAVALDVATTPQEQEVLDEGSGLVWPTSSQKNGKNFIAFEDARLTTSWLEVAQDPVVGDEQKAEICLGKK